MNKLYFTRVVEKTRGLFTSRERERVRHESGMHTRVGALPVTSVCVLVLTPHSASVCRLGRCRKRGYTTGLRGSPPNKKHDLCQFCRSQEVLKNWLRQF